MKLTDNNFIHHTAFVGDEVTMGHDNYIGPFCYLTGRLDVGDNNRFEAHCSVGTRAEHKTYWDEDGPTEIVNDNMFREYITINAGTEGLTSIGSNVIMLRGSHVAHDCVIEDGVTLSCDAIMLGHVRVMKHSNCGSGCQVHQHQVIGSYSMIGMGCIVTKKTNVEPGQVWVGNPAKRIKTNMLALDKHDVDEFDLVEETARYSELINAAKL